MTKETLLRDRSKVRVLLAEDNAVNQQVAVALLSKRGYQVVPVTDGLQAVEAVRREAFDIVLMDIQMPEMDGLEATRAIRTVPDFADLPIVALTAHAFAAERQRCRDAGMNDFLAKPFKPEDLFRLVDRWTGEAGTGAERNPNTEEKPMTHRPDRPPVDLDRFRAIMREAGVEHVVDTTVGIYLEEAPEIFNALSSAAEDGRTADVRSRAHSLRSSSGNIRAGDLAQHMKRLEQAAAAGEADRVRELLPAARTEFDAVMSYLRSVTTIP